MSMKHLKLLLWIPMMIRLQFLYLLIAIPSNECRGELERFPKALRGLMLVVDSSTINLNFKNEKIRIITVS
jgi:hypothetical protein